MSAPEPQPGHGVFIDGVLWHHDQRAEGWAWVNSLTHDVESWEAIADRTTPAVPLADVVKMLDKFNGWGTT